jgi:hypothetical protein
MPTLRHGLLASSSMLFNRYHAPCEGLSSIPYIVEVRCMACCGRNKVSNCPLKQRPMWRPPAPRTSRRLPIRACADVLDAPRSSFIATARVIPITALAFWPSATSVIQKDRAFSASNLSPSHMKHSERTYYGNYASLLQSEE